MVLVPMVGGRRWREIERDLEAIGDSFENPFFVRQPIPSGLVELKTSSYWDVVDPRPRPLPLPL